MNLENTLDLLKASDHYNVASIMTLNKLIIKVDFFVDFLYVDWLEEITFLTVLLVSKLSVLKDLTIIIHVDVFKALPVCEKILFIIIQEEVLFILGLLVESCKYFASVLGLIFLSKSF